MESDPQPAARRPLQLALMVLGVGLVLAAVAQELRRPSGERAWHGRVAGVVPYDFRRPTLERLRAAWWDPRSNQLFTPRVWGIGWAVNLPVLFDRVRAFAGD